MRSPVSKTMFACVSFSLSALPFERAVRLIALLELERVDVDCYTDSNHVLALAVTAPLSLATITKVRSIRSCAQRSSPPR